MTGLEVTGRDVAREAYRLKTRLDGCEIGAWVPECLMQGLRPGGRPSHQEAYEWIAAHKAPLIRAITRRACNQVPRSPYDLVTLIEEAPDAH